jgi:hypothetical protein
MSNNSSGTPNIDALFSALRDRIIRLNVSNDLKNTLLEEIDHTNNCYANEDINQVINCLTSITDKLKTQHITNSLFSRPVINRLLFDIFSLQQIGRASCRERVFGFV